MPRILIIIILFSLSITACKTNQEAGSRTIYLMRHAEKMTDSKDPDLSPTGVRRAQSLNKRFNSIDIDHIYSTDYKRTIQTVQPIATEHGIDIKTYDPRQLDSFSTSLKNEISGDVIVSGHSNTTPALVNLLLGRDEFPQLDESEYGDLYVVSIYTDSTTVELREF